jgi:hypothetical protein
MLQSAADACRAMLNASTRTRNREAILVTACTRVERR